NANIGIAINRGSFTGGITNSGTIASGGGSFDILVGAQRAALFGQAINFSIPLFAGGITNSGTLRGAPVGVQVGGFVSSTSTAFVHVNIASFSGGITNTGTIMLSRSGIFEQGGIIVGGFASSVSDAAVVVVSRFSGNVSNNGLIFAKNGIIVG